MAKFSANEYRLCLFVLLYMCYNHAFTNDFLQFSANISFHFIYYT